MSDAGSREEELLLEERRLLREKLALQEQALQPHASRFATLLNNFSQGATFGFADEMAAGLAATVKAPFSKKTFGEIYDEQLAIERGNLDVGFEAFPGTSVTGQIAGGVGTGVGLARTAGGQLLSQVPRLPRLIGIGAGEGALFGAGTAEENRLTEAAKGGAIGALVTPVASGAVNLFGRILRPVAQGVRRAAFNTPTRQAERLIGAAAERDELFGTQLADELDRLGPNATLADAGENLSGLARGATAKPGPARTVASRFLNERQRGQQQRLLQAAGVTDADEFKNAFRSSLNNRRSAAGPYYDRAYAAGVEMTPEMTELMGRPSMRAALRKARVILDEEGIQTLPTAPGDQIPVRLLDAAKREIDDRIGLAIRQGRREQARRLVNTKNALLDQIDSQVPDYGQARQIFASEAALRDSVDLGRSLMTRRLDPEDVSIAVEAMTDGERYAFRIGALRGLVDKMEALPETRNAAQKLIESSRSREILELAFPDDASFRQFLSTAEAESTFSFVRNRVLGGSPTTRIAQEVEDLNNTSSVWGAIATGGDPVASGIALFKSLGFSDVSDETLREVSNLLFRNTAPTQRQLGRIAGQSTLQVPEVTRQLAISGAANALINQSEAQ